MGLLTFFLFFFSFSSSDDEDDEEERLLLLDELELRDLSLFLFFPEKSCIVCVCV
jgi:hypothetical protein